MAESSLEKLTKMGLMAGGHNTLSVSKRLNLVKKSTTKKKGKK